MNEQTKAEIAKHRASWRTQLYDAGKELAKSLGDKFYFPDILALAAVNRGLCLARAFCDLIESENFVAAAPLARLQLDTCLRLAAIDLVEHPDEFANKVFGGAQINLQKGRDGKQLSDRRLVKHLAEHHPWVTGVYEQTSGFVHLSDKHIFNTLRTVGDTPADVDADGHNVKMKVSERDEFVPDEAYLAALRAFGRITELVGLLVRVYAEQRKVTDDSARNDHEPPNVALGPPV